MAAEVGKRLSFAAVARVVERHDVLETQRHDVATLLQRRERRRQLRRWQRGGRVRRGAAVRKVARAVAIVVRVAREALARRVVVAQLRTHVAHDVVVAAFEARLVPQLLVVLERAAIKVIVQLGRTAPSERVNNEQERDRMRLLLDVPHVRKDVGLVDAGFSAIARDLERQCAARTLARRARVLAGRAGDAWRWCQTDLLAFSQRIRRAADHHRHGSFTALNRARSRREHLSCR